MAQPLPATRLELKWRRPLDPAVYGYGPRVDPGGYCYRLFRDGRLSMSGTAGANLGQAKAHAARIAPDARVYVLA